MLELSPRSEFVEVLGPPATIIRPEPFSARYVYLVGRVSVEAVFSTRTNAAAFVAANPGYAITEVELDAPPVEDGDEEPCRFGCCDPNATGVNRIRVVPGHYIDEWGLD